MATALRTDRTDRASGGPLHRASAAFHARPRLRLAAMLAPPLAWMLVIYLGSLTVLFLSSFWRLDPFSGLVVHQWGLQNFTKIFKESVYLTTAARTAGI